MRRVTLVSATFLLAAATGHLMQNGISLGGGSVDGAPNEASALALGLSNVTSVANIVGAELPSMTLINLSDPATLPPLPTRPIPPDTGVQHESSAADALYDNFWRSCAPPVMLLTAAPGAMVDMDLSAPCHPDEQVLLRYDGIGFNVMTDSTGRYMGVFPALSATTKVDAILRDDEQISTVVTVPGTKTLNRIALSWRSVPGLGLNVFEYGAGYGEVGHIHAAAPREPQTDLGGYLISLGDPGLSQPMFAQVYTAPVGLTDVSFTLEAPVTEGDCGQDINANSVRAFGGATPEQVALSIAMPECDAVGDAVVMPLPDLPLSLASAG